MTTKTLASKFGLNVLRIERPTRTYGKGASKMTRGSFYIAFRGGNGTGEPVIDVAEAYTLASLATKLAKIAAKATAR